MSKRGTQRAVSFLMLNFLYNILLRPSHFRLFHPFSSSFLIFLFNFPISLFSISNFSLSFTYSVSYPIVHADRRVAPSNLVLTRNHIYIHILTPPHWNLWSSGQCDANLILEKGIVRWRQEEDKTTDRSLINSFIYFFFFSPYNYSSFPFFLDLPNDDGHRPHLPRIHQDRSRPRTIGSLGCSGCCSINISTSESSKWNQKTVSKHRTNSLFSARRILTNMRGEISRRAPTPTPGLLPDPTWHAKSKQPLLNPHF